MKDFVVYTVLTGNYEDLLQPKVVDNRFDYILFSNDPLTDLGVWNIRPIPNVIAGDSKRLSRYPKTHPDSLLCDYKASLYIDANIQILDEWVYNRVVELYDLGIEYAGIQLVLTGRDCVYEHAFDMCLWRLEYASTAVKQCHAMYKYGFPQHYGINENNVIFRTHNEKMKVVNEEWWRWITTYSSRDQFSFMFCLWKHLIDINYFLPIGEDARNSSHFSLINHDKRPAVQHIKLVKLGIIRRLFLKNLRDNPQRGLKMWRMVYESPFPILSLYFFGLLLVIIDTPRLIYAQFRRTA